MFMDPFMIVPKDLFNETTNMIFDMTVFGKLIIQCKISMLYINNFSKRAV